VYASFCLFIEKHRHDIGNVPQVLAISTSKILEALGFVPTLKWPNDILLEGKKIAGILTETTPLSDMICIITGIGLNVNMSKDQLQQIDCPATSLLVESGRSFDVIDVLDLMQKQFQMDLEYFMDEGFYPFLQEYRRYMPHDPSTIIRFSDNKTVWEGTIQAIENDGSLSLRLSNGEIRTFLSGEILF
jgi:BirA family biotin operon repressor/biotin-[acetyl-CoA-carboxylase] ligase